MTNPKTWSWTLQLEVQSHERTHAVRLNDHLMGYLPRQSWSDVWTHVGFAVPRDALRAGHNLLTIQVGQFIPDGQGVGDAWDELRFRNIRLVRNP